MKRWNLKKLTGAMAVLMAGVLAVGCGKQEGATTAQKEFVYVPEYEKLELEDGVDNVVVAEDMIYFTTGHWDDGTETYQRYLGKLKIGETTPEMVLIDMDSNSNMMSAGINEDGNFGTIVMTYLYDEEEAAKSAGEEERQGEEVADKGKEDAEEEITAEETEDDEEEKEADGTAEDGGDESAVITGNGVSASFEVGTVVSLMSGNEREYQEPIGQKTELWNIGTDGKVLEKIDLSQALEDKQDFYIRCFTTDKDGNVYIGYDQEIMVLDSEGKKLCNITAGNWINTMFTAKDGQVLAAYYGENGMEVSTVDLEGKKMGDSIEAFMDSSYGSYTFAKGTDTDILFSSDHGMGSYNFGDDAPQEILNWIDCDIDRSDIKGFAALDDGRILVITSSWNGETQANQVELAYLTRKKGSEVPEKKILTYGTMSLDYYVRKQIIEFNRMNQEYRIEVKEYFSDYSPEGYGSGLQQMNTDIISGKCPDIIDLSSGNAQSYVSKGVVEDLYPYMEADAEINREDYLENVLKAYEKNGKLYAMPVRFYIGTVLAKVSDVGDAKAISMDKVMELAKSLPKDAELYDYASKESILNSILRMNLNSYVNWDTGECKFNSGEFIKALEFSNTFPKEFNYDEERPSMPARIREGKLIMADTSISSMQEYQMYKAMFGEPITFIGYPTSRASGSYLVSGGSLLAMSSKSPYKDGAWQFIRIGITKEVQENSNYGYGFPVMKSALDKQFAEDMEEEYYEGEDGKKEKQPKTTWGYEDFSIEIYAATQEEVSVIRELIDSADSSYQYDEQIYSIIREEAAALFEGQKTAKDVADIIQSRIQVYVNENR